MKMKINRREFLKYAARLAALTGLSPAAVPDVVSAMDQLVKGDAPLVWVQAQSCSGCSVSLLNSDHPGPAELLTRYISLKFHSTLSTATGHSAMKTLKTALESDDFILAVEGSIPYNMPKACVMGHDTVDDLVALGAKNAKAVVAIGACATFGGIPGAENNPTGAISVPDFLERKNISKPTIRIPGCPSHPDWVVGTLVHVLSFGLPPLDTLGRPKAFFSKLVHEQCPRFRDYEREHFAKTFDDDGCLFKLGCVGTNTHADCSVRFWNSRTNSCIIAGSPCVGCASETFARQNAFPFYRNTELQQKKREG